MKYKWILLIVTASITVFKCLMCVSDSINSRIPIDTWIVNLRAMSIALPLVAGAVLLHFALQPKQTQPKLYMQFVVLLLLSLPASYAGLCLGNFIFALFNEIDFPLPEYILAGRPKAEVFLGLRWYIALASSSAVFIVISVIKKITALITTNRSK